ncbi:low-density lipoprotein receptor-related protein 6-like [Saccostrea echinata]|uniref:low-density lipoprotein receptor-related protein 6-like n=1 Tax=Saccostrea echinata TaxID=191078 RepID=UPI002A801B02|nr:low-density lipoprotein receptor-related protein 6-like [Saccostrea echinata]
MKPAYDHNNTTYKIVVQDDLFQPEGLTLDPEDGLMFFSDNGVNPRIEKASMDGSDRTVIVHIGLLRVLSLTVDTVNNLLFWADFNRHTLVVSNYDGSSRRVVRRQSQVLLNSVVFHRNILHVVSSSARLIAGYDATAGSLMYGVNTSAEPFVVHVYDAKIFQSHADSCASRRCQHICVNSPSGSKCLCAEGYRLSSDGSTCREHSSLYEKGFIVSNATIFSMYEVNIVNGIQSTVTGIRISSANITTFAVDTNSQLIYFVDSRSKRLKKTDIITRNFRTVAHIGSATDMNFDWVANLLIWIDPTGSSIQTYSINSGSTTVIYSGLQQPASLTVDAYNGYLFWLSGQLRKSIMRGNLRRTLPEAIVSSPNLDSPTSLYYDITSNRIYWLDRSIIKSCLTNGSNIKNHTVTLGATQIFVYKDFFGWMDKNRIYFARKSANSSEIVFDLIQSPKEVVIYDSSLQRDKSGVCNDLNGGCEDICVPIQSGRKCECDFGLQLQTDMKTCDASVYTKNFLIVVDNSHGRILQIDINTGSLVKLPISVQSSSGIAFDRSTKELIYSDGSSKTIMSTTLHGKNTTLVYVTGYAHAERLTIDYSTGNIYFSAVASISSQSYIGVVHRKSFLHKTLLSNLHRPKDIVLYPSKGFLYWTETGSTREIGRSYMDGTSQTFIATTEIGAPTGLAIDFTSNRLYWTDAIKNRIEYSDLNGGNRHVLTTDKDAFPFGIIVHGQYLYYIASNRQGVTKINKATGSKVTFMSIHPELGVLDSLDVYADDSVDLSLSCSTNNGNCSTFCFPIPNGRTCGCADDVDLKSDQTTCQGDSDDNLTF